MKSLVPFGLLFAGTLAQARGPSGPPKLEPFCPEGTQLVTAKDSRGLTAHDQAAIKKSAEMFLYWEIKEGRAAPDAPVHYEPYSADALSYEGTVGKYPVDSVEVLDRRLKHMCAADETNVQVAYLLDVASVHARKPSGLDRNEFNSEQLFFDPWARRWINFNGDSKVALERRDYVIRVPHQPIVWMLLPLQKIEGNWKLVKTRTLRQFGELKRDIGAAELKKARQNRSPTCVKQPWMGYCWSDESEERLKLNKSLLRAPWSVVPGVAPSTAKHSQ